MNAKVTEHLIDLYKQVADMVDGGEKVPKAIRLIYDEGTKLPEVRRFYEQLIHENPLHSALQGRKE